jgi:hypothetical protein
VGFSKGIRDDAARTGTGREDGYAIYHGPQKKFIEREIRRNRGRNTVVTVQCEVSHPNQFNEQRKKRANNTRTWGKKQEQGTEKAESIHV